MQQPIKLSPARWHRLAEKFDEAATIWADVESHLTLWPEGDQPPKLDFCPF